MRHALAILALSALLGVSCVPATNRPPQLVAEPNAAEAYNLACAHALRGDAEAAVAWLRRAAEAGFSGVHLATTDPDLDSIREHPGYAAAIDVMRATSEARLESFRRMARDVEPAVVLPPGYDPERPAPLIVALHGSGGTGRGLAEFWLEAAADVGAILVTPDALRRAGDGYEWRFVDESEWLVLETIEHVAARHPIDRRRVVLTGFSQGANIALILGTRHPALFCGLIPIAGFYEPEVLGDGLPQLDRPRIGLVAGGDDPSAATYRRAVRELRAAGYQARLELFPGVGHSLPPRHRVVFAELLEFTCDLGPRVETR